jgi:hypothetical protein
MLGGADMELEADIAGKGLDELYMWSIGHGDPTDYEKERAKSLVDAFLAGL